MPASLSDFLYFPYFINLSTMADGSKASIERLKFSNFKLKTLLNITETIITNSPVDRLLAEFKGILQTQLNIGKILIYILQGREWRVILKSGVNLSEYESIVPDRDLAHITDISGAHYSGLSCISDFDFIIPIIKDGRQIAFVIIGDLDEDEKGMASSIKHLQFVQTLSNIIIVSIENHRLMEENMKQAKLKEEMALASRMQNMLVPKTDIFHDNPNICVDKFYLPHYEVGGDYYDFDYLGDNGMFFCIADVSGKGMSAAILMSNFQASLKALITPEISLSELVSRLNGIVVRNAEGDRFITLFIGRYDFATHTLRYVNAGHNAPLLYNRNTSSLTYLTKGCPGLGMLDELPCVHEGSIKLDSSSKLLCFTDGVVEIERDGLPDFGQNVVEQCVATPCDIHDTMSNLLRELDIQRSNKSIRDDVTILGIDFII